MSREKRHTEESSTLVWYRLDLRIHDNPALSEAFKSKNSNIHAIFVHCPNYWRDVLGWGSKRIDFIQRTVQILQEDLARVGVPLHVCQVKDDYELETIDFIKGLIKNTNAHSFHYNRWLGQTDAVKEFEQRILKQLSNVVGLLEFEDNECIVPPGYVMVGNGEKPYNVFTPFVNKWNSVVQEKLRNKTQDGKDRCTSWTMDQITVNGRKPIDFVPIKWTEHSPHPDLSKDWPAGETAAKERLEEFLKTAIKNYNESRDSPGNPHSSSLLSAYQAIGAISMKECYRKAASMNSSKGRDSWINELAWRDFYRHIWYHYKHIRNLESFKAEADNLDWRVAMAHPTYKSREAHRHFLEDLQCWAQAKDAKDIESFRAWQAGQTGFPIVDAGMRQLATTGFMHNRLRMITASFLTKDLLIDWRLGERHFRAHLIDIDEPSNNGGWQWSASTGTDAQPYFRIFSPILQGGRVDPDAAYCKKWCPELEKVPAKGFFTNTNLHSLTKGIYPKQIVDHAKARITAIATFKAVFQK